MFRFLLAQIFPFCFRQPQVGDRYAIETDNPFKEPFVHTVKKIENGWVLYEYGVFGSTGTIKTKDLIGIYRRIE